MDLTRGVVAFTTTACCYAITIKLELWGRLFIDSMQDGDALRNQGFGRTLSVRGVAVSDVVDP